ncbi:MAG: Hfq-related RNA-binding protein [Dolichospermum sp.]
MTSNQFDTGLPSIRQVQNWIKEKITVEFRLMTGDLITGQVFWQDHNCISIFNANNEQITLWRQAIAYMKPLSN